VTENPEKTIRATKNYLSDLEVRSLKIRQREYMARDGGGLYVNVNPNGSKYFQFRYTFNGKQKKMQIGVYPVLTLQNARTEALRLRSMVAKGEDPISERRKNKALARLSEGANFQAIAEEWLELKKKKVKKSYLQKIGGTIRSNCFPRLGHVPIQDIFTPMIVNTLLVMEDRGAIDLMHRLREHLHQIFEYAKSVGRYVGENPVSCLKRSVILATHHPVNFEKLKNPEDMGVFLHRLEGYRGKAQTKILAKLQLLTATRPVEAREAVWEEFDFETKIWTIPADRIKMEKDHKIPLANQVVELLESLKRLSGHSKYLFPSPTKTGMMSDATLNTALKTLWPEYLIHPHGFRHFFSTEANESRKFDEDLIETALSHGDEDRVRGTYNKAEYVEERRIIAQWYADYIDGLRNGVINQKIINV
jgi:integrase